MTWLPVARRSRLPRSVRSVKRLMRRLVRVDQSPGTVKQLRAFLEGKTGPADPGHKLASYLLEYLAGKKSDDNLNKYWDKSFSESAVTPTSGRQKQCPPYPKP